MLHVSDEEIIEMSKCSTESLAWRLAWAREYRGRIEMELMSRLENGENMEFDNIKVTQPRPKISYSLSESGVKRLEYIVSSGSNEEVDSFFYELRAQQNMGRPWLSLSVMERYDDDNT